VTDFALGVAVLWNCFADFSVEEVADARLSLKRLFKAECDMLLTGKLQTFYKPPQEGSAPKRARLSYAYDNREVCEGTFCFIHGIHSKQEEPPLKPNQQSLSKPVLRSVPKPSSFNENPNMLVSQMIWCRRLEMHSALLFFGKRAGQSLMAMGVTGLPISHLFYATDHSSSLRLLADTGGVFILKSEVN